ICRTLATAGAVVVPADVQEERAAAVIEAVRADGGNGMAARLDLTDAEQAAEVVRRVVDAYDRLDILVNNAGVDCTASIEELSVTDWDRVVGVNLRGAFVMAKQVFPVM